MANIVFAGTQSQWNAVQKLAEDNGGGKYNLTQTIHFNGAQKVCGYYDVFTDDWFGADVTYVKDRGLMNGTGEGVFEPGTGASRGMVVTILYRLAGSPATAAASTEMVPLEEETDVSIGSEPANEADVIQSEAKDPEEDSSAAPQNDIAEDVIPDEGTHPEDVILNEVKDPSPVSKYTDADQISDWAADAMAWCVAEGIINGVTETTLEPQGKATRAHVATMLMRCSTQDE
jgi:hypothetical protein